MAVGNYGTIRGADVSLSDIEVFLHFTPSRSEIGDTTLTKLVTEEILFEVGNPNNTSTYEIFGGMYTLKLPSDIFGKKGFYTLSIKPLEIRATISDTGVLSVKPDVKGLVFNTATIDSNVNKFQNGGLVGYRIEYLTPDGEGNKIRNFYRIITSNNKVESVQQALTNTNQKAVRFKFNDNSPKVFVTVTPSSTSNVKPNVIPFIGEPGQEVVLTNTFFNPIQIEIEMVDHDIETLAYALYGPQSKSVEDGIYTIYDFNKEIYKQFNLYEIKDEFSGNPLFEVKDPKINIDFDKDFNDISEV